MLTSKAERAELKRVKQAEVSSKDGSTIYRCLHRYHVICPVNKGLYRNPAGLCQAAAGEICSGKVIKHSPFDSVQFLEIKLDAVIVASLF